MAHRKLTPKVPKPTSTRRLYYGEAVDLYRAISQDTPEKMASNVQKYKDLTSLSKCFLSDELVSSKFILHVAAQSSLVAFSLLISVAKSAAYAFFLLASRSTEQFQVR